MRRMTTKTHGIVDYLFAAALPALPRALGWSDQVRKLLDASAASAAAYSVATNYERGLVKLLPMKAHLALDALGGGVLIGAALMLDDEEPEVRAALAGIGLFEIAAALTTEARSTHERQQRSEVEPGAIVHTREGEIAAANMI